jgi:tRNA threonylcarbamoyladenosine modification (KEOPS) complex  Pcc1 subunit
MVEGPKVRCSLRLEFSSDEEAAKVNRAIELDNEGYLTTSVEGHSVLAEIEAQSLNSLLHTLDDLLAATALAERIVSKKR